MRYIIVAFFFLGLVFYEMSGGADFDPEATRMSRIETPLPVDQEKLETVFSDADPALPENVTRVALNLNAVQDVVRPARKTPIDRGSAFTSLGTPQIPLSEDPPTEFLPSLIGNDSSDGDTMIIGSTIGTVGFNDNEPAALPVLEPQQPEFSDEALDIRSVSGDSVNVRGGPGTNYAVVNRLILGDEVEVLQDSGDGWVQLRPLNGSPIGWMASFLLSEG